VGIVAYDKMRFAFQPDQRGALALKKIDHLSGVHPFISNWSVKRLAMLNG
jgi:hypothetical protein